VRPELFRPTRTCPPNFRLDANYQVANFDNIRQSDSDCFDDFIREKFPRLALIIYPKSKFSNDFLFFIKFF